mmetsp:Transcript_21149/g.27241  ORF Transcript_21149/g.27241 Transcript_21149/m.27241 type:complete len:201 (-) Transcript_21149:62-664(-)
MRSQLILLELMKSCLLVMLSLLEALELSTFFTRSTREKSMTSQHLMEASSLLNKICPVLAKLSRILLNLIRRINGLPNAAMCSLLSSLFFGRFSLFQPVCLPSPTLPSGFLLLLYGVLVPRVLLHSCPFSKVRTKSSVFWRTCSGMVKRVWSLRRSKPKLRNLHLKRLKSRRKHKRTSHYLSLKCIYIYIRRYGIICICS